MKVILDTNFLLIPGQFKLDIFSEIHRIMDCTYELCIIEGIREELQHIAENGSLNDRKAAKIALKLILMKKIKTIRFLNRRKNLDVDAEILSISTKETVIATQDKLLRDSLKRKGIPIIFMRNKKYLVRG